MMSYVASPPLSSEVSEWILDGTSAQLG